MTGNILRVIAVGAAVCAVFSSCRPTREQMTAAVFEDDYVPSSMLEDDRMSETLSSYLRTCREEWMNGAESTDLRPLDKCWLTEWKTSGEYRIVYDDDRFVSFWADEWLHGNGNCSSNKLSVGTLLRSTGRRIHLKDLYSTSEEEQQLQTAWEAAVARGNFWYSQKKYNPDTQLNKLDNPFITDNFFIKGKEIHFIYQKGEVAANCFAAVEVVIPCWAGGIMGR